MANHVQNIISFSGDQDEIQSLLNRIRVDDMKVRSIDFEKIAPIPERMDIEAGSRTDQGLTLYNDFVEIYCLGVNRTTEELLNIPEESEKAYLKLKPDIDPKTWELGRQAFRNQLEYGATDWYHWCIDNWGTKWNAYTFSVGEQKGAIYCQTAWSAPHPIMEKLSGLYPTVEITHSWADEDLGCRCGKRLYLGGECIDEYIPSNDVEAIEFACEVWEYDIAEMGYVKNAAGTDYIRTDAGNFPVVDFQGDRMLFCNSPITSDEIPEGTHCYYYVEQDGQRMLTPPAGDGLFLGAVITKEPIDLGESGCLVIEDFDPFNYCKANIDFEAFLQDDFGEEQNSGMGGMI